MSDVNNNPWGFNEDDASGGASGYAFKPGINEGVNLREFSFGMTPFEPSVPQLKIIIGKGESVVYGNYSFESQYDRDAKSRAVCYHLLHAFGVTDDQIRTALTANKVMDAEGFVKTFQSLLPSDFATREFCCILGYGKQKASKKEPGKMVQFLEIPKSMKVTGAFFTRTPEELTISERVDLERVPEVVPENNEDAGGDDTDW